MTKFLVQVDDVQNFPLACQAKAEIIFLKHWQKQQELESFLLKNSDYAPKVWLYAKNNAALAKMLTNNHLAQKIVLPLAMADELPRLDTYKNYPLIFMADVDNLPSKETLEQLYAKNINFLMLGKKDDRQHFLNPQIITNIGQFFENIKPMNIKVGIIGNLQAPDMPRLLPFFFNFIGCTITRPIEKGDFGDAETINLIRNLLPIHVKDKEVQGALDKKSTIALGTDRIIVEDFILPMEIGAYQHEYGHKQNVRFNIKADIMRLSDKPEDMRHIFSYDIILDGIRNIIALGHIVLVETLAERVAAFILAYPLVKKVKVRVEKLELGPKAVGIEIKRKKKIDK